MKSIILTLFLLVSAAASADVTLVCQSTEKVMGWKAIETDEYLRFTAYVDFEGNLSKAEVTGAYESDVRDLEIDQKYNPKAPSYKNMNRYGVLEDAWHWFTPILPKNLQKQRSKFAGYMQIMGENGYKGTEKMNCYLINRIGN